MEVSRNGKTESQNHETSSTKIEEWFCSILSKSELVERAKQCVTAFPEWWSCTKEPRCWRNFFDYVLDFNQVFIFLLINFTTTRASNSTTNRFQLVVIEKGNIRYWITSTIWLIFKRKKQHILISYNMVHYSNLQDTLS